MTFLGDYSSSTGRWFGRAGLAVLLTAGLIGGYSFDPSTGQKENPSAVISKNDKIDALLDLKRIYDRGFGLKGGDLIRGDRRENVESLISSWESLPKDERYEVLTSLVKSQLVSTGYDTRDFTRENIGSAMFFMLGGGL